MPGCIVHLLHRNLLKTSSEDRFVGDLHAIAFTNKNTSRRNAILSGLRQLLESEEFEWERFDEPNPEWRRHTESMMRDFLGRRL
eukprot:7875239-Pyramimonas_sp.AAC.1